MSDRALPRRGGRASGVSGVSGVSVGRLGGFPVFSGLFRFAENQVLMCQTFEILIVQNRRVQTPKFDCPNSVYKLESLIRQNQDRDPGRDVWSIELSKIGIQTPKGIVFGRFVLPGQFDLGILVSYFPGVLRIDSAGFRFGRKGIPFLPIPLRSWSILRGLGEFLAVPPPAELSPGRFLGSPQSLGRVLRGSDSWGGFLPWFRFRFLLRVKGRVSCVLASCDLREHKKPSPGRFDLGRELSRFGYRKDPVTSPDDTRVARVESCDRKESLDLFLRFKRN